MKITVIPTGNAPMFYSFNGDIITAHDNGVAENFDLSAMTEGDQFTGVDVESLDLPGSQIIRKAERDAAGELHVTLCQRVGPGHWEASDEFDSSEYDPDAISVVYRLDKPHAGRAYAITRAGKVWA